MNLGGFCEIRFRGRVQRYFRREFGYPRFNEIDHYGVLWNGHYVNYFECARLDLCREFAFDMERLQRMGFFLPVYNYEVTVKKPVFPGDRISVAVRMAELEESRMVFEHLLLVGDEVRAFSKLTHILMSSETKGILYQMPEELKDVLRPMQEKFAIPLKQ